MGCALECPHGAQGVPGGARCQHSPLLSLWWVCCLAQSAGIPWISTRTKGSTMELPLSLFSLGSCCAVITCGTGTTRGPADVGVGKGLASPGEGTWVALAGGDTVNAGRWLMPLSG